MINNYYDDSGNSLGDRLTDSGSRGDSGDAADLQAAGDDLRDDDQDNLDDTSYDDSSFDDSGSDDLV